MLKKPGQQALDLVLAGAEVIDLGAESTSPTANPIQPDTEWARLQPVIRTIHDAQTRFIVPPKISIDTRSPQVASKALAMGIDWINDVSGLDDPAMRAVVLQANVTCVVMHHLNIPERRDHVLPRHQDPTQFVLDWAKIRLDELEQQGFSREKIIFDPGIGFGKMAEQSFALLKNVEVFAELGTRLLIGHSRKTFFFVFRFNFCATRCRNTGYFFVFS